MGLITGKNNREIDTKSLRKPSGTFFYMEGLLKFLREHNAKMNEAEACWVTLTVSTGTIIMAIAVDDFLATASSPKAMDKFHNIMSTRYKIKRLGRPRRYLGCHFHYKLNGTIALSQLVHIDKTLNDAGMLRANGKHTPYPNNTSYHPPTPQDIELPERQENYMQLVGDLRYIADCTRPDLAYIFGLLGAALSRPTVRHWNMLKATLCGAAQKLSHRRP